MNIPLSDRLISWAQNEEMIDSSFLAHGRDCIEAAMNLRGGERYCWFLLTLVSVVLIVVIIAGVSEGVKLQDRISALQVENTRLQGRTCGKEPVVAPSLHPKRKVTG